MNQEEFNIKYNKNINSIIVGLNSINGVEYEGVASKGSLIIVKIKERNYYTTIIIYNVTANICADTEGIQREVTYRSKCSSTKRRMSEVDDRLGAWMSAALEDPGVCASMKHDIDAWFMQFKE